jgi:mono/diheme cytochrome c family protein
MRILKRLLAAIVVLILIAVVAVYGLSSRRLNQTVTVTDPAPAITSDSATLVRGEYLVRAIGKCSECHTADLGGTLFIDGGPLGKFYSANLTSGAGGIGGQRSDAEIVTAIRHAVGPAGRKLLWMPSADWNMMSDADVSAIVAYIRSVPNVDRQQPASSIGPLGRVLYALGQLPLTEADNIEHGPVSRSTPVPGVTVEYGRYLAHIGGCHGCHGPTLSGGPMPGAPPDFKTPSNLTPEGIGHYTEQNFFTALREGKRPDGSPIDSMMPVKATRLMTDDDTRALFTYLKSVPSKPFGNR